MNELRTASVKQIEVVALILAWAGIWGTWVWHGTISLSQGALDLAEWSTFLPDVRFGGLARVPELIRFGVAFECIALAFAAGSIQSGVLRWGLRILAILPGVFMLPPYPDVLSLWWSASYGLRFTAASLAFIGSAASLLGDRLEKKVRKAVLAILCLAGVAVTIWGLILLLPPFAVLYSDAIIPGWGLLLFLAGLITAAASTVFRARRPTLISQGQA